MSDSVMGGMLLYKDLVLVWFHIPKTAGTSLCHELNAFNIKWAHILFGIFDERHRLFVGSARDHLLSLRSHILNREYRVVFGHMTQRDFTSSIGSADYFRFATMLRDPIERFVSEYFYLQSPQHPESDKVRRRWPTLSDYAADYGDGNVMAHYLESYRGEPADKIIERLERDYAFVGLVERYEEDFKRFAELFGLDASATHRANTRENSSTEHLPKHLVEKLRSMNDRDLQTRTSARPYAGIRLQRIRARPEPRCS